MSDLIARHPHPKDSCPICADEIERLRADVERWRGDAIRLLDRAGLAEARLATARRGALEEAAKVADEFWEDSVHNPRKKIHGKTAADIAVAIRALSPAPAPEEETEITRAILEAFHMEGDCLMLTEETRPMYARQAARAVLAHINKGGNVE